MARGSTAGLLRLRQIQQKRNTEALRAALAYFSLHNAEQTWTYKEICVAANLKSTNPIRELWNRDIRDQIDAHNRSVRAVPGNGTSEHSHPTIVDQKTTDRAVIQELRIQLRAALEQVSKFEAEADWFERAYKAALEQQKRLEERLRRMADGKSPTLVPLAK